MSPAKLSRVQASELHRVRKEFLEVRKLNFVDTVDPRIKNYPPFPKGSFAHFYSIKYERMRRSSPRAATFDSSTLPRTMIRP